MCGVISGDYGGVFGLQQPRRVFGDWAGLRCLGGLAGGIVQSSEGFFFFFCQDPNIQQKENPGHSTL